MEAYTIYPLFTILIFSSLGDVRRTKEDAYSTPYLQHTRLVLDRLWHEIASNIYPIRGDYLYLGVGETRYPSDPHSSCTDFTSTTLHRY
jgi:hypothetical protein